ncbi:hypothetical protein Pyrfu_0448 [Pyrolobus fumarii 1A]|uniref:Uncharacterized protein n=1 Tax=Pyrolobus fumarii (strain DSM 11204 / 1A) TaxID=694429 RepID=G0EG71_PYRF1|nr:hypothetical protein [Pyrolobus fumarii]AEM38319.1 hypothetical protein Pyrfu_0448 [Pyrolobus fumarii 1A]
MAIYPIGLIARGYTPLLFTWDGLYTFTATGPSASPMTRPVPMPSTFTGMLASLANVSVAGKTPVEEVAKLAGEALGCKDYRIRGYLLMLDRSVCTGNIGEFESLYIMVDLRGYNPLFWVERLRPSSLSDLMINVEAWVKTGVALSIEDRVVIGARMRTRNLDGGPGAYTVLYTPPEMRKADNRMCIGVYAELFCEGDEKPKRILGVLGGDRGIAEVVTSKPILYESLKDEWNKVRQLTNASVRSIRCSFYALLASPLPLTVKEAEELVNNGKVLGNNMEQRNATLAATSSRLASRLGVSRIELSIETPSRWEVRKLLETILEGEGALREKLEKLLQPRLTARGIGYDIAYNAPRPYHVMLEPGGIIAIEVKIQDTIGSQADLPARLLEAIYVEGIADDSLAKLGWGTVIPTTLPRLHPLAATQYKPRPICVPYV